MVRERINIEIRLIREETSRELRAVQGEMRAIRQNFQDLSSRTMGRSRFDDSFYHHETVHLVSTPPPELVSYAQPLLPTSPTQSNFPSSPPLTRVESVSRGTCNQKLKKGKHDNGKSPQSSQRGRKTKHSIRYDRETRRRTTIPSFKITKPPPTPFKIIGEPHRVARNKRQVRNEHTNAG
jgi:hypothetical protein